MFQVYAIIGGVLSIPGIICTYYFITLILTHKVDAFSLTSLSESLVTVFIGIFYIYSAVILSGSDMVQNTSLNFTNNIDDITIINNTEEITPDSVEEYHIPTEIYQNDNLIYITSTEELSYSEEENHNKETESVNEGGNKSEEQSTYSYSEGYASVQAPTVTNQNDQFLINYKNFFKDIIKQKLSNSSIYNGTAFDKGTKFLRTKTKRDLQLDPLEISNDECFKQTFIINAGLLYSFIHCILTLINYTLNCKKYAEYATDPIETIDEKSNTTKDFEDTDSEKNEASAPVGPLFDRTENIKIDSPNMEHFRIKSSSTEKQSTSSNSKESTQEPSQYGKLKLVANISLTWVLPVIALTILYSILSGENTDVHYDFDYINSMNFNTTRADPNILNIINQKPFNITSADLKSAEINKIIKNVYTIVNEAHKNVTNKKPYFTPLMVDIIYFLNKQNRNPRDFAEKCRVSELPLKIYYFFIFVVIYFIVILYTKVTQMAVNFKSGNLNTMQLNTCILAFSILWLPSVLDLFIRLFLTRTNPNIVSDIFLALGNTNRLFTMRVNYADSKKK